MSGNVWEWCWDLHGSYPAGTQTDYRGSASGTFRVKHGGSWQDVAFYCTVALRFIVDPSGGDSSIGFRVVRP